VHGRRCVVLELDAERRPPMVGVQQGPRPRRRDMTLCNQWMAGCAVLFLAGALAGCGGDSGSGDMGRTDSGGGTDSGTDSGGGTDLGGGTDMGGAASCMTYCAANIAACTGADAQYDTMDHCVAECNAFMWPAGMPGATSGNSLACRVYHTGAAATA